VQSAQERKFCGEAILERDQLPVGNSQLCGPQGDPALKFHRGALLLVRVLQIV
jgi:hypothetical protein